jgi:hypothetical protein
MVAIQPDNQDIAQSSRRVQIPHVANVQQIKTSVRRYDLFASRPQLFADTRKVFKLDDFSAHSETDFEIVRRIKVGL